MHVLILSEFFWPDTLAGGLVSDLAEDMIAAGDAVTVLASRFSYHGTTVLSPRERRGSIEIIRPPSTRFGRGKLWGRAIDHATFIASAAAYAVCLSNVDVVVAVSLPPFMPVLGSVRKRLRGAGFVYWLQDLYPDVAVRLGVLSSASVTSRMLECVSRDALQSADAIVAIGECMADRVREKGDFAQLEVIHNWTAGASVEVLPDSRGTFRAAHGLKDEFVILYGGNLGLGHDFATLLDAARSLVGRRDIVFLFVGVGERKLEVVRAARELPNVRFLAYQDRATLSDVLGAADLGVVTLKEAALGLMVPSKLFGHLASGRPVLFIGPAASTVAHVVTEAGCGAVFANGDSQGVAAFVTELARDAVRAREMGAAARATYDRRFGRARSTRAFIETCERVVAERSSTPTARGRGVERAGNPER